MLEELGWLVIQRPDYYQDELQWYFYENWHVWASQSTISRAIGSLNLTHKRLQFKATQQSCELWHLYLNRIASLTADQLVFADESSMSRKTLDHKFGYTSHGNPAVKVRPKVRTDRYSLLPVYVKDGFLADPLIFKGVVDGDQFIQ